MSPSLNVGTEPLLRDTLSRVPGYITELRRAGSAAGGIFDSADGRWTIVSTAITASVASAVTILALAATPPDAAGTFEPRRTQAALPYDLLSSLSVKPILPGIAPEDYRAASVVVPGLNSALASVVRNASGMAATSDATAEKTANVSTKKLKVGAGGTIMGMLQDAGVPVKDAAAVITAMQPLFSPRSIRPGQVFEASFGIPANTPAPALIVEPDVVAEATTNRLLSLSFSPSVERQITVELTAPAAYAVNEIQKKLASRYQRAGATIDSSLYLAAMQAGIPASIVVEMIHMFSYDVDFQRDVHPGDEFEVFYNNFYTAEGQPAKTGNILAATMTLGGKKQTLFRFETTDGPEYFENNGSSAKSMLMKTPVDGARISSGFGLRRHPILGYNRMHKGVDFAVPIGTPVMAGGSGTVTYAGRSNGYGNLVIVSHSNGYSTAYGHLSRFGKNIKKGTRVTQGQIVAYSGNTGVSTGPHLHYEIRVKNQQVNPAKVKVATGRRLEGQQMKAFNAERNRIEKLVAALPVQRKVANASDLRRETAER